MPLALPLPDGRYVTIREGETPEQTYQRAMQMYPEAFAPAKAKTEPTVGGQVKEFFKGLAPGAVGLLESAAVGASALLPEETEKRAREGIAGLAATAKKPFEAAPGYEDTVGRKFGEAAGSIVPFLGLGPFGLAGRVGMAGLGTGAGAGEARTRAEQEGATAEQRSTATGLGAVVGISEMFAPMRILGRIDEPIKQGVVAGLKRVAMAGGEEALQEAASQAAQNLIAKGIYKPEQEIVEQVGESAAYGGAVGALAQGLIDMTLGRRARKAGAQSEIEKARAEADAARAEEEARKADPDYPRQFITDYDSRKEAFIAARKALKKPGKDATPDVWAVYDEQRKAVNELREGLAKDAKEYNTLKTQLAPILAAEAEQAKEAEKQTQIQADLAKMREEQTGQALLPGFEAETVTPPTEVTTPTETVDYAEQARKLTAYLEEIRSQAAATTVLADKTALAKKERETQAALDEAKELAEKNRAVEISTPAVKVKQLLQQMNTATENGDVQQQEKIAKKLQALGIEDISKIPPELDISKISPKLALGKPLPLAGSESKAAYKARVYEPGPLDIEAQEQETLAEAEQQRETAATEAERERKVAPEVAALQQMGQKPALTANIGVGQISGAVDKLVENLRTNRGTPPTAKTVVGGFAPISESDELRAQLNLARTTGNKEKTRELLARLDAIGAPETEKQTAGELSFAERAKAAGVEGRLSERAIEDNRVSRAVQHQLQAFDRLADFVQSVRESDQNVAQARKDTLRDAAEKLKDTITGLALNEIDARRAQNGLAELEAAKKLDVATRISSVLNELITRGAGVFNIREIPAVVRGTEVVQGARQERPPLGQRMFNNLPAATNALRGQMRNIIDNVTEVKGVRAVPEPKAPRRVIGDLTLRGAEKERSVEDQFNAALSRASEEEKTALEELQAKHKNLSPEAQDLALEQARRVETGQALDIPAQLEQELADLRRAGVSETGQAELFTGESERGVFRATTNNFIKFLASGQVQKLRMVLAKENKIAEFRTKRAETIQKRLDAETAKRISVIDKLAAPWFEHPVTAARKQFEKAVDKNKSAVALADEINAKRTVVRNRIATMLADIQDAHNKNTKHLKDTTDLYDSVVKAYIGSPEEKAKEISLAYYEKELAKAQKAHAASQKTLDAAKALQVRVLNDFAADTVDNAIVSAGSKAERKIELARRAVIKAQNEEAAAKQRLEILKNKRKEPTLLEQVQTELEPKVTDVTRVYRDTSDPSVQAKVALARLQIGKAEAAYEKATTAAEKATAIKAIEDAYSDMYKALNDAPQRRELQMSEAEAKAQEAFDKKQQDVIEQTAKLFEDAAGIAPLKMTERKIEGVVRVKQGAAKAVAKKETVAAQEAQFLKEQTTGEYAASTLEKLAKARARRNELQNQIDYIDEHKAKARTPARARQNAARTKAVAERNALDAQIEKLETTQKGVIQKAKIEKRAEKELFRERNKILRSESKLQEVVEGSEGPAVFRTATTAGPSLKEQTIKRITDKVVEGWTNVPEITIVADENGLPENIRAQAEAEGMTGKIPGLYDTATGKVYLVASNLRTAEDVVLTIAHEIAGHFGLRSILGNAYAKTMNRLYDGNRSVRERADVKLKENPTLSKEVAVEEVLADMAETGATPQERNLLQKVIDFIKNKIVARFPGLSIDKISDNEVKQIVANARNYVKEGATGKIEGGTAATSGLVYRTAKYASPEMAAAGDALDPFVSKNKSWWEKTKANLTGLAFETQLVDRFAGFERLSKYLPEHMGTQMMYYLRMYDQRMNMVSQAVANGAPRIVEKTRPDGKIERIIEAKAGPSIKGVVNTLKDANPMVGNAEAVNRLFTAYMAGIRANNKGFDSLHFGEDVTQADLDKALSVVNNNKALKDIFDKARGEYNEYNRNLVNFLVETGALNKKVAERLTAENDYIPFYREQNGVAQLLIGGEAPIRIGSIKEQPYLHELVGGDQPILDFLTSSVQNTNLLVDMGMRNIATKNAVFELVNLNAAKFVRGTPSGKDVVKFKIDGKDQYAVLATERVKIGNKEFDTGIPADIVVKGMEGIPTQMPFIFRAMAMPAQLLRKGVTLSPLYMARQLFRDSLAAPILSGADFTPVLGALKQIGSPAKETLERRGIVGGQQFHGTSADLSMILRDVAEGKPGWMSLLAKAEAKAMEADALTRRAQYNSYIEQGLSEMEATLMALESMNFNKRGASPSIHIANAMIPFFNAQIQGLNVLYKAMTGKMPFNDKLKIRKKLLERGGMMATAAVVYAMMMQDDEAYENATPDQKYGNWFVPIPGIDEKLRIPVPFEVGYIFKALPEALVNSMTTEHGGEEAVKAFKQIVLQTIPGGSSYGIPQALKPAIEVGLGKSFYTGRDILSAREKELLPEEQFRANTTEIAKAFGKLTGTSPIMVEQLVKGYTGTMGLAFLQALSVGVPPGESPEAAVKRLSDYPVFGSAFQPNDAGGIINSVYERMNDAKKVADTYTKMLEDGRVNEAEALLQRRGEDIMQNELGKEFRSNMQQLTAAERAIQSADMSAAEKRKQLDELRRLKISVAKTIREVSDQLVSVSFSL